jgi:hypothetical protein
MLKDIVNKFFPGKTVVEVSPYGNGHINDTYKVILEGEAEPLILQKINVAVFTNPDGLVDNHIKIQRFLEDGDSDLEIPSLCPVSAGGYLHIDASEGVWRMMNFITDSYYIGIVKKYWQESKEGNG